MMEGHREGESSRPHQIHHKYKRGEIEKKKKSGKKKRKKKKKRGRKKMLLSCFELLLLSYTWVAYYEYE